MSTYTETIWNIIGAIEGLAGIACVTIVLVALFKIIVGDEQDQQKYIKRIKNALIALVLILTCVNIGNTVLNYFTSNDETSTFSIGSIENTDVQLEEVNGGLEYTAEEAYEKLQNKTKTISLPDKLSELKVGDLPESGLYHINGSWYYLAQYYQKWKNIGGAINKYKITCLRLLCDLDTDQKTYYSTDTGSQENEGTNDYLYSNDTGNIEMWVFEYPSTGNKIKNADELADAVLGRLDSCTETIEYNGKTITVQYYEMVTDTSITFDDSAPEEN